MTFLFSALLAQSVQARPLEILVVTYNKEVVPIPPTEQTRLVDFLGNAAAKGDIDQIEIAVWSDKNFPAKNTALPKTDQDFAEDRGEMLQDPVEDNVDLADVDVFNMADITNPLVREDDTTLSKQEILAIKTSGGPRKAVVLVKFRGDDTR